MGGNEILLLGRRGKSDRRRRGAGGGVEYTYPDDPTVPVTPTDPDPVEQDEDEATPITGTLDPITAPDAKKKGGGRKAYYVSFATSGGEVTITATADGFTPYLTVLDASTGAVIAEGLSPLTVTLPVGSYIVELTSLETPTVSSTYALTLSAAVPALGYDQRWSGFSANPGLATVTDAGVTSLLGAPSGTIANGDDDAGPWVVFTTLASAFSQAFAYITTTAPGLVRREWAPEGVVVARVPGALTGIKVALGYLSGNPPTGAAQDFAAGGIQAAAFRYFAGVDTAPATATWRAVTSDGSAETVTDTGVAVSDAGRTFRVDLRTSGAAKFYVDGVLVATHTTTLPAAATPLGLAARVVTTDAGAKAFALRRAWQRHT